MRRTSERRLLPRITAFFAALILCLQMMVVPALAQEDWSMLSITLSWTDASGNPGFAMATPVATGTEQAFWVQVDPSAPLDQLTITLSHPYHAYTFEPADGSVLQNVQDSGAEMNMMTGIPIIANDAETGNFADSYTLYVSTQSMPVVPEVPTSADVTVNYVYEDNELIGSENVTITGAGVIYPNASIAGGLQLSGQSVQQYDITVTDGVPSQNPVTFIYVKPEQYADVTVVYQYKDGTVLDTQTKSISESQNIVPESGAVSGLTLTSSSEVYVQVENGVATPNVVPFTYEKPEQSANVTINYQYEDNELIDSQTIPLTETTRIIPESDSVTDLELAESSPREVTVEVADGVANPAVVTFIYKRTQTPEPAPNPVTVTVTIQYLARGDSHAVAAAQTQELSEGTTAVYAAPEGLEAGYVLDGESAQPITVDGNGNASANPVTFYYKQEQVPQATITIRYVDQKGVDIVTPAETRTLDAGNIYPITPDSSKVPAGYAPLKTDAVTVEVNAQGIADKTEVIFYYQQDAVETPIPTGALIQRWGYTNDRSVNWRDRPSTKGRQLATFNQNTYVWMIQEETNDAGEGWTRVMYNGQEGYVMSRFLTVLSQAESDYYTTSNGYTPVPTETAAPTPEVTETTAPTNAPTDTATPTAVPAPDTSYVGYALTNQVIALRSTMDQQDSSIMATLPENTLVQVNLQKADEQGNVWSYSTTVLGNQMTGMLLDSALTHISEADARAIIEANATPTASPTATPTAAPDTGYTGYAVTNQLAAIRTGMDYQDTSILSTLPQNTLVKINLQNADSQGTVWSYCETVIGNRLTGMVLDSQLTHIDEDEAQSIINANATATPAPTATPPQQIGYAVARGDNVYMRTLPSEYSDISAVLSAGQVAYVTGQSYEFNADGTYTIWHIVQYGNQWGYIRADLMRLMDQYEVDDYLDKLTTPAPTLVTTPQPYDENSLSSYGYVSANTVNFRKAASTSSTRIATLRQYAFCLVLGTENVNGTTWYKVNYGGNVGYVQGNYFKQMSISELESFLTSEEYKQGIANNASSSNTTNSNNNTSNGSGKLPSAEDQTVNEWTNPNNGLNVSYEPFDPFATPEPLATTTAEPSEQPTEAATTIEPIETLPVEYPTEDTEAGGGNGSAIGWVIGAILLLGGGGGGYAYMLHKQNQRKAAQRAAQRRAAAQQQRTSGSSADGRPYARTNAAAQPRTGTYTTGGTATPTAQRPTGTAAAQRPTAGSTVGTAAGTYGAAQGARKPYNTAAPTNTTANSTSPYARPEGSGASAYGTQGRRAGRTGAYGTEAQNAYGRTEVDNESNSSTSPVGNTGASEQGTSSTATTAGMYGQAFRPNGGASAYGTRGTSAAVSAAGSDSTTVRPTPRRTASTYGTQRRSTVGDQPTKQVPKDANVDFQTEDNSDL